MEVGISEQLGRINVLGTRTDDVTGLGGTEWPCIEA